MGNPKGVKRDFEALETRRMEAVKLLKKGWSQSAVAREVGVHRQSVSRWAKQLQEAGRKGLKRAGRAGRKPRLSPADLRRVERELKRGPEALGYTTSLWTSRRVAELIEQECGVRFHPSHVWRILQRLGWSCQRPASRAIERNEEAIRYWKKVRWPEVKKKPSRKAASLSSSTKAV